ncbi:Oidioi.mRNA.OKI2018_I69.chr2.g6301.t1.cds [Oikopleura dioica]|uniref:Oidioi.mRNA.OKI2018_I69.chr2.g6301.t1.cds n=1 Tax=Oikopleura dioica TaxID=34765 RepID=A0ABN7TBX3_OIKDI|nr:Oidioi.mRNA.OKI2018_I69.chr2.g6301.t1.cds [Oikopleura dioica]
MVFHEWYFPDSSDKLKSAKKLICPSIWGCTGEMSIEQFRRIIISMWALLTVSGILVLTTAIKLPYGGGVAPAATYIVTATGTIILGLIVCGFGTSMYSAQNKDSADMTVRKGLFCMTTILFLFADSISICFSFIIAVFSFDPFFLALNLPLFVILLVLFVLALVTLIKQTCCLWNKNDREWLEKNEITNESDGSGQGINEEKNFE